MFSGPTMADRVGTLCFPCHCHNNKSSLQYVAWMVHVAVLSVSSLLVSHFLSSANLDMFKVKIFLPPEHCPQHNWLDEVKILCRKAERTICIYYDVTPGMFTLSQPGSLVKSCSGGLASLSLTHTCQPFPIILENWVYPGIPEKGFKLPNFWVDSP